MKIIVSHDVDHLYATDHLFRDLYLEKLWARSFLQLCRKQISLRTFLGRLTLLLRNRMQHLEEVMSFDRAHGVPSVFFFGMKSGLSMAYSRKRAAAHILCVLGEGFDAGIHGIDYQNIENMKEEKGAFAAISGQTSFGIRNHYVRFDEQTFEKMAKLGYLFDSTWFNKKKLEFRAPYRVGGMWEFPLHIMDNYIFVQGNLEKSLQDTFAAIREAEEQGMPYCTILFHDYQFDDLYDPLLKQWYMETIAFCEKHYEFISYRDAIRELEAAEA